MKKNIYTEKQIREYLNNVDLKVLQMNEKIKKIQEKLKKISAEKILAGDKDIIKYQNQILRQWMKIDKERKKLYSRKGYWNKRLKIINQ